MVAVYGNLMVMGIAIALFYATVSMGRRSPGSPKPGGEGVVPPPHPTPKTQP